ncbi:MAG: coproporphyrinogen oxidase [Deltaproteobacteria bacterium]|nr:coproporphyrinogen oxidase [Deltaproteobacteria bacterium]
MVEIGHLELGPIRPPSEAQSLLIRVTRNCPWNQCEFCHTYKGERFSFRPVEEIKKDIDKVGEICEQIQKFSWTLGYAGEINRQVLTQVYRQSARHDPGWQNAIGWLYFGGQQVFLQDANTLMVKTPDLVEILKYLKGRFPFIERITSYGRARTLAKKTVDELKELRQAGLSRIHIGMESGYDPLLDYMKKGVTAKEQVQAGQNVVQSGISLCEYVMPGLGGARWWREHAVETARVLNQINSDFIRFRTLYVRQDMPLYEKVSKGEFERPSDDAIVREIRLFIETLEGIQSTIVSDHILNLLEEVQGKLPGEKEAMLAVIDRYLALPDEERLRYRVGRRLGHYRSLDDLADPSAGRRIRQLIEEVRSSGSNGPRSPEEIEKEVNRMMENYI